MPTRLFRLGILIVLALGTRSASAQISVRATVDKTEMGDAETLVYTVEADGSVRSLGRIEEPRTRGLTALQTNPDRSWGVTIVNGQRRQRLSLTWRYRPLGPGTAYVGATTLDLDGQTYTTDPILVTVVPQAQRPTFAGPLARLPGAPPTDLFLDAEPTKRTAWVGEQIVVDYVLYFEPEVLPRNSRIASAWDADGFWREELELDRYAGTDVVVRGGRTFEAAPIKRLAVFPTRSGSLRIDSLEVEIDVLRATRLGPPGSPRSFLYNRFGSRFERETVTAPPVEVEVRPLPPAPPSFSGAVGQFGLAVEAEQGEVEVGEAVRVTATVSGRGNLATLEAPAWDVPDAFAQYPARAAEQIDRNANVVRGRKAFTYTLVPRSGGTFTLPPVEWTFFEPGAGAYRTLRSDSLRLRVIGPAAPRAETVAPAPDTFREPGEAVWQRPIPPIPFYRRPWVWAAFALPALAFLGLVAVRRRSRDDDSPEARRLRAFPDAERGLREAVAHLDGGRPHAFYRRLDLTVRHFLADRLGGIPSTLPDLDERLAAHGVTPETRAAVLDLLRESEAAQFAPPVPRRDGLARPRQAARDAEGLLVAVDAEAQDLEEA